MFQHISCFAHTHVAASLEAGCALYFALYFPPQALRGGACGGLARLRRAADAEPLIIMYNAVQGAHTFSLYLQFYFSFF